MSAGLTLSVTNGCDDKNCICTKPSHDPGITVTKDTNQPTNGFIRVTHTANKGSYFTLGGTLSNGDKIRKIGQKGKEGTPIPKVSEVSVYYWNGASSNPILLEIITGDGAKTTRYGRPNGEKIWKIAPVQDLTDLQDALDRQNCHNNDAVPFNIKDSQTGDLLNDSKSECIKNKKITGPLSQLSPPGSDYTVTGYTINDNYRDMKISRVTLNGRSVQISLPTYPIGTVMLYSYPSAVNVPLMIELKSSNGGDSTFYESISQDGNNWIEVGDGKSKNFYSGDKGNTKPTDVLSEKLDEVLCKQYNNVTLDLSYKVSTSGGSYCCEEHKKDSAKISVEYGYITVSGAKKTSYYKHNVSRSAVAGIYYNENNGQDKRNNVKLSGVSFPISGIQSVYTFYCNLENPVLVYLGGTSPYRGWYQKNSGDQWTWIPGIHNSITEADLKKGLDCTKWQKLKKYLMNCGCNGLQECPGGDPLTPDELERQLKQEEEEAKVARNQVVTEVLQPLPPGPTPVFPQGNRDSPSSGPQGLVGARDTDGVSIDAPVTIVAGTDSNLGEATGAPAGGVIPPGSSEQSESDTGKTAASPSPPQQPQQPTSAATNLPSGDPKQSAAPLSPSTEPVTTATTSDTAPADTPTEPAAFGAETVATGSALWTAFGSTSGTLAGSGATFFAGWKLYNRYKQDPWVIQVYLIVFLKNVPC